MLASDTWGISGPTFLSVYLAAALALVGFSLWHRIISLRVDGGAAVGEADGPRLAYLAGGPRRSLSASFGALHLFGAVDTDASAALRVTGPLPAGASRLDHAVYDAARHGVAAKSLADDPGVATALEDLRAQLVASGWLRDERSRALARIGAWLLLALAGLGVVRIVAGVNAGRPVGYLLVATIAIVIGGLVLQWVPYATRAGQQALRTARRVHAHLAPAQDPAWTTYGVGALTLGVALFGTAPLWAADPSFASTAGIEQAEAEARARSTSAGGGEGGGGGGDGGGGGGCGGGCGGCGG
jgi:uncharacterized protein (TIGR04222 family)